jgi:hypothetical protein
MRALITCLLLGLWIPATGCRSKAPEAAPGADSAAAANARKAAPAPTPASGPAAAGTGFANLTILIWEKDTLGGRPARLMLDNQFSQRVGMDLDLHTVVNGIPGAEYLGPVADSTAPEGRTEDRPDIRITRPATGVYDLTITGVRTAPFGLAVESLGNAGTRFAYEIEGGMVPGRVARLRIELRTTPVDTMIVTPVM